MHQQISEGLIALCPRSIASYHHYLLNLSCQLEKQLVASNE
jgi:hypothetical protein